MYQSVSRLLDAACAGPEGASVSAAVSKTLGGTKWFYADGSWHPSEHIAVRFFTRLNLTFGYRSEEFCSVLDHVHANIVANNRIDYH